VGKTLARFFGSLFILGCAVGRRNDRRARRVLPPRPEPSRSSTVNDASDPASPLPAINCAPGSETDCTLRAALQRPRSLNTVTINLPDPKTVRTTRARTTPSMGMSVS